MNFDPYDVFPLFLIMRIQKKGPGLVFSVCDVLSLTADWRMRRRGKPVTRRFAGRVRRISLLLVVASWSESESHKLLAPLPATENTMRLF